MSEISKMSFVLLISFLVTLAGCGGKSAHGTEGSHLELTQLPHFEDSYFLMVHTDEGADACKEVLKQEDYAAIVSARECLSKQPRQQRFATLGWLAGHGIGYHFPQDTVFGTVPLSQANLEVSLAENRPTTDEEFLGFYMLLRKKLEAMVGSRCQNPAIIFMADNHIDRHSLLINLMAMLIWKDLGCGGMGTELATEDSVYPYTTLATLKGITCQLKTPGLPSIQQSMHGADWEEMEYEKIEPVRKGSDAACLDSSKVPWATDYPTMNQFFFVGFSQEIGLKLHSFDEQFGEAATSFEAAIRDDREQKMFSQTMKLVQHYGSNALLPIGYGHFKSFEGLCRKHEKPCQFIHTASTIYVYPSNFSNEAMRTAREDYNRESVVNEWREFKPYDHFVVPGRGVQTAVEARDMALRAHRSYQRLAQ